MTTESTFGFLRNTQSPVYPVLSSFISRLELNFSCVVNTATVRSFPFIISLTDFIFLTPFAHNV